MLNSTSETLVSFKEATRLIPTANGRRLNASTVWRWAMKGVHGVKLEHVCFGRGMFTSKEALARFANCVAEARITQSSEHRTDTETSQKPRETDIRTAEEKCAGYGV